MKLTRRDIGVSGMAAMTALAGGASSAAPETATALYGLISQIITAPGKRDELAGILLGGTRSMPGCLAYVVAADASLEEAIWITEIWTDKASHDNSLALPEVRDAITRGRPLISSFGSHVVTTPLGGVGLPVR